MSRQTLTLDYVDFYLDGKSENREIKKGIFSGCAGELDIEYLSEKITTKDIEILLLNEYRFREIGYETVEEFQQYFKNCWNRYFFQLKENIQKAVKLTLINSTEKSKEKSEAENNSKSKTDTRGIFSNTPNEYLTKEQELLYKGATSLTDGKGETENENIGTFEKEYEHTKSGNDFLNWINLSEKNRNIIYRDFIDKFHDLFLNTVVIKNFNRNYI